MRRWLTQPEVDKLSDRARVDLLEWIWRLQLRGWPQGVGWAQIEPLRLCEVHWEEGQSLPDMVVVLDDFGYSRARFDCPLDLPESVLAGA